MTFVEMCIKGIKKPADIDDFIEEWHNSPKMSIALHEAIGVSIEVYSDFLISGKALDNYILRRMLQVRGKA